MKGMEIYRDYSSGTTWPFTRAQSHVGPVRILMVRLGGLVGLRRRLHVLPELLVEVQRSRDDGEPLAGRAPVRADRCLSFRHRPLGVGTVQTARGRQHRRRLDRDGSLGPHLARADAAGSVPEYEALDAGQRHGGHGCGVEGRTEHSRRRCSGDPAAQPRCQPR